MNGTTTRARWGGWVLGLALCFAGPGAGAAQMNHPTPVPADDPRARRAGQVVERLLTREVAQVESYLAEHGAEGYGGTPRVAEEAAPLIEMLEGRTLAIEGYLAGAERSVLVVLMDAAGDWVLVQVGLEAAPPFRVTKLARAELRMR